MDLVGRYGNWPLASEYLEAIDELRTALSGSRASAANADSVILARRLAGNLGGRLETGATPGQVNRLRSLGKELQESDAELGEKCLAVGSAFDQLRASPKRGWLYIPRFRWHGPDNQYHHWLFGYLRGDLGISYHDGRPVGAKVWSAWGWTFLINGLAIILAFGLAIPLGVWSAVRKGTRSEKVLSGGLFLLYAMPTFWVASLCLIFLTTPAFGMDWFPTLGPGYNYGSGSEGHRLFYLAWSLFLPVACLTYPALALIVRQIRGSMLDVLHLDFIRTARAKGLSEKVVVWKHAFRNALFPLITLSASILPELFAGSIAIEVIFSIPGMGRLTMDSIFRGDWPVVYAILVIGAILTILGILLADILYYFADPRLSFRKRKVEETKTASHAP